VRQPHQTVSPTVLVAGVCLVGSVGGL
jgi:hypothetical protein